MKLIELSITNYRSIKKVESFIIAPFQALIGENNAGKSNLLSAIEVLLSGGAGGVKLEDFYSQGEKIIIKGKFEISTPKFKKIWKPYLLNEELILEKYIWVEKDPKTEKSSIKSEYHGYQAEPSDWFLSISKIKEREGNRPNYRQIVLDNGLPDYFLENDAANQAVYQKGLNRYFSENDIEYDAPDISSTQALGLQSNVIASLPKFYLLKAITDYSSEIDKRSSSTTFRRLMAELSERILKQDPKYQKIEKALQTIQDLLNEKQPATGSEEEIEEREERLSSIGTIEDKIQEILSKLMPSVTRVKLNVITEDVKSIFSRGVELSVDDGVETDVLLKGHGLQRCIVFSLLQTLILNEKNRLIDNEEEAVEIPILLAIEEPELYIHPQLGKLFYDVLVEFSDENQVIYSTHSTRFIDVSRYENIALLNKNRETGTKITNCDTSAFTGLIDRKIYQGLSQLNNDVNELFFSKRVLLVEGPEDKLAVTETLKKIGRITNRSEEIDVTIIVAGGTGNIPFFTRVLNAFCIKYTILHDLDLRPGLTPAQVTSFTERNQKIADVAKPNTIITFPIKLEDTVGMTHHFSDQYHALTFFSDANNINQALESIINDAMSKLLENI